MGRRMATNLARELGKTSCPPLIVWNRSPAGVDKFKKWASEREANDSTYIVAQDINEVVKECVLDPRSY